MQIKQTATKSNAFDKWDALWTRLSKVTIHMCDAAWVILFPIHYSEQGACRYLHLQTRPHLGLWHWTKGSKILLTHALQSTEWPFLPFFNSWVDRSVPMTCTWVHGLHDQYPASLGALMEWQHKSQSWNQLAQQTLEGAGSEDWNGHNKRKQGSS